MRYGTLCKSGKCGLRKSPEFRDLYRQDKSDFCRQQENQLTYDKERGEAFIPNREIIQEFLRSIKTGGWDGLAQALARSEELLRSREL